MKRFPDRWWKQADAEMGRAITAMVSKFRSEPEYAGREALHAEALSRYNGRGVGVGPRGYRTEAIGRHDVPLCYERSLCETVLSQIAAAQRPKASFLTTAGDWKTRRRAKRLDRYCEGVLRQPHGRYVDGWELGQEAFLDAAICGTGAIRADVDHERRRVTLLRVPAAELYVDIEEAYYGSARTLLHVYMADRDRLAETYPKHAAAIASAHGPQRRGALGQSESPCVEVAEVWTLGAKHAVALADSGHVLEVEDWKHEAFPFAFIRWTPDRQGFWGSGLVQEVGPLADALRTMADRMRQKIALCAQRRVYYAEGSVSTDELKNTDVEVHIPYSGPTPPTEITIEALSSSEMQLFQVHSQLIYDLTGVSESAVTARKEPGVNAAVAMRELNNVQSRRLQRIGRAYEMFYVDLARAIVTVSAQAGDVVARWAGKSVTHEMKWSEVSLEDDAFAIQVAPVSSLPNDPAGRLAMAQDLLNTKAITPATFKRLLAIPDLDREMSHETAESEWTELLLDRLLDADEGEAEDIYEAPDGFLLNVPIALLQAVGAYYAAKVAGAPEHALAAVRRFCEDLNTLIQKQQEAAAALAAPPPQAPPMGAPPPMMPGPPMAA